MALAGKAGSLLAEGIAELRATDSCLRGFLSMAEREGFESALKRTFNKMQSNGRQFWRS
jgi:hypothetical protein